VSSADRSRRFSDCAASHVINMGGGRFGDAVQANREVVVSSSELSTSSPYRSSTQFAW
jgi:hypothetical protein